MGLWLLLFHWAPTALHPPIHLAWVGLLTLVGIWASSRSEAWFGKVDPRETVIDEVVGQQITYWGLVSLDWKSLALGFILFRLFDIWKPYPIKKVEGLGGGTGIMLDDVLAGIYALLVLLIVRKTFHWM